MYFEYLLLTRCINCSGVTSRGSPVLESSWEEPQPFSLVPNRNPDYPHSLDPGLLRSIRLVLALVLAVLRSNIQGYFHQALLHT